MNVWVATLSLVVKRSCFFIKQSKKIAFGGVISSLALLLMFMSSIIPSATFSIPAMAGILIMLLMLEFDKKTAFISYTSVSFLSLMLVADKEAVLIFIFFFGNYPIIKSFIERVNNVVFSYLIKFGYFNVIVMLIYHLSILLLGMGDLVEGYDDIAHLIEIGLLVLLNFVFFFYDYTLTVFVPYYFTKIKPKFKI